ncbi:MAG: hypothetical protein HFI74_08565 [Lachnospiraceae bacterium]|jgi:hypothetical protein|nr:hypothetical protein [Lachnospiraceae bacterium]
MGKKKKIVPEFDQIAYSTKIPPLILDQKWHHLFPEGGKPKEVERLEQKLNKQLASQGGITNELKELKAIKSKLMKNIVVNMDEIGENGQETKKLQEDRRLITEINGRIEERRAELSRLQEEMEDNNAHLMVETMEYCYQIMSSFEGEREELATWIAKMRTELKLKIIRKDYIEDKNREIYTYLHDIFGAQVLEAFDLKYDDEYKIAKQ